MQCVGSGVIELTDDFYDILAKGEYSLYLTVYLEVREVGGRDEGWLSLEASDSARPRKRMAVLRCGGIADLITDFNSTIQPHPDTMG